MKITEFNHQYQAVSRHFLARDFFTVPSFVFSSFTCYISVCEFVRFQFLPSRFGSSGFHFSVGVSGFLSMPLPSHKDANHFGSFIKNSCVSLPLTFFWGSLFPAWASVYTWAAVLLFAVQHRFSFYILYLL